MEPAYLAGGRSKAADRISELPDYIIHEILERLKYSQTTLALSRRWMQIWLSYPILEFHCDDESFDYSAKLKSFLAAAARKLSSSHHNRIKALRISSKCSDFIRDVLDLIVNREPEEIVVECYTNRSYQLFATEVINNPRLRILDLCFCRFWEFPDTNQLDMRMINLRVICLENFSIDDKLLNRLIAGSPLLEELKLSGPKKRISRLDICNNPNLKILQLENCTVWELIQIAGTTKSLEIMSLNCSDLDISPSALPSLKSLKINYAHKLTGEFINNMIANLPSLQSLYLYHIGGIEELKIRSDTLQELKLGHVFSNVRIHIDAPRLVDVQYRGCLLRLPAITRPANFRKAQLCNSITLSLYPFNQLIEMDSLIKLKDFLAKLRQQFRSVQLHFYSMSYSSFSGDAVACDHGSLIPMIEHVEFNFDISRMDGKDGFIDALFWSCHPKYLCLMNSEESYQGCSSLTGYKANIGAGGTMKRAYLAGGRSKEADRISELPDNIIHEILERLKYSQITLALSRRWMQIWLSYPILEFHCDDESFDYSAKLKLFLAAAARKLSSSQHSRIKALRISSKCSDFIHDVLDLIVNREPEEIFVKYHWNLSYQLFPTQLINNPRLRILDLCCCKFWEFPDTNHLDMRMINLRVLRLEDFRIDDRPLNCLIAASPLLEELKLSHPMKRIWKLDICNNPNLKILQLEDCTIWELIQIAGTTKSLETMSLRFIDLDISPSQLTSLKSLKINYAHKLTGEFINNMIANLPSLQSLNLYHIRKVKELEIRSNTLQQLKLDNLSPEMRLRIHIDAPRLVDVHYYGSVCWLPTITRSANLREAQLCTFTVYLYLGSTFVSKIDDFIELKDFLAKLSQQFRFDQLCLNVKEYPYSFMGCS
ncbi:hypothetical protein LINPERPRIM_LOCUS12616 [Linum perenne]